MFHLKLPDSQCAYVQVGDVILQQHLDVANALLGADKGEWDHSLSQHNTKAQQHMLV